MSEQKFTCIYDQASPYFAVRYRHQGYGVIINFLVGIRARKIRFFCDNQNAARNAHVQCYIMLVQVGQLRDEECNSIDQHRRDDTKTSALKRNITPTTPVSLDIDLTGPRIVPTVKAEHAIAVTDYSRFENTVKEEKLHEKTKVATKAAVSMRSNNAKRLRRHRVSDAVSTSNSSGQSTRGEAPLRGKPSSNTSIYNEYHTCCDASTRTKQKNRLKYSVKRNATSSGVEQVCHDSSLVGLSRSVMIRR